MRPGFPSYVRSGSPTAPLNNRSILRLTGRVGNILSKLPHTRPYRIYHRVLTSKDILPAPWGSQFRSLMKAVSLLMTSPGPHSRSASGLGIRKQNPDPCFVRPPPDYALLGLGAETKCHTVEAHVTSTPSSENEAGKKAAAELTAWPRSTPPSPLLERSRRVPCMAIQSAG